MERNRYNLWKVPFVVFYAIVGASILYNQWNGLFYEAARKSFADLPRLWGCVAFSLLGFSALAAFSVKTHAGDLDFPWSYLWKFPALCLFNAMAVFAIFQMFERTNGYLFNFTAYPLAFLAGLFSEVTLPLLWEKAKAWAKS